eukprot:6187522-Pleurochrysis_carterae.AAC.1
MGSKGSALSTARREVCACTGNGLVVLMLAAGPAPARMHASPPRMAAAAAFSSNSVGVSIARAEMAITQNCDEISAADAVALRQRTAPGATTKKSDQQPSTH